MAARLQDPGLLDTEPQDTGCTFHALTFYRLQFRGPRSEAANGTCGCGSSLICAESFTLPMLICAEATSHTHVLFRCVSFDSLPRALSSSASSLLSSYAPTLGMVVFYLFDLILVVKLALTELADLFGDSLR